MITVASILFFTFAILFIAVYFDDFILQQKKRIRSNNNHKNTIMQL